MLASTGSNPERRRALNTFLEALMPDEYLLRLEASGEVTPAPDTEPSETEEEQ
ncbi:MAG TPA: hypothetical protein VFY14_15175 [Streptomyces sp.]|nr:hypothetical protein [Streptomyces sp.]